MNHEILFCSKAFKQAFLYLAPSSAPDAEAFDEWKSDKHSGGERVRDSSNDNSGVSIQMKLLFFFIMSAFL